MPWVKLAKYFAGELTKEEAKKMEIWIKADSKREEQIDFIYKIWVESGSFPYEINVDNAWKTLEYNMDRMDKTPSAVNQKFTENGYSRRDHSEVLNDKAKEHPGRHLRRIALVAASILILLTTGLLTYQNHQALQKAENAEEIAKKVLSTKNGERAVYTLNDGSKVVLHADSKVEVPLHFNSNKREIFLEGEAYFEVTPNPDVPFVVHSGEAYTRVLGTKFLVRAWPGEFKNIEVIVEEGSVSLGGNRDQSSPINQEVTISKNQKGILAHDYSLTVSEVTNLRWHLGWIEGRLILEDRKLSEILPLIERWYAVKIIAEGSGIKERRLTAEIDYTQPMMEILKGIALSLDLNFTREGQIITFSPADEIQKDSLK
ncbi:FecR family protein [Rhodohalobacter sp. SW132]|uniref:FecR family protein n=1 Tax=Rhodohalobacter sp. SW132 TaxID=2293433 RepID=UPI001314F44A|nr:FecR family protein [Rhodohalobacter sp. SW132]